MQKAIDAYAEAKIQGIQCRAQEAVMKERDDIATREYRNDQLADLWAQVTLQSIGIEAPQTKEPL